MPFGIVGQTGPRMRQVVEFRDRSTGRGTFGGELGTRHCNQWGLYGVLRRVLQRRDTALFRNYFGQTCCNWDLAVWLNSNALVSINAGPGYYWDGTTDCSYFYSNLAISEHRCLPVVLNRFQTGQGQCAAN